MHIPRDPSHPLVADEAERLSCLSQLEILDTSIDPAFEQIVDLTKSLLRVPVVLVTLVDEHRLWFKARRGVDQTEIAREPAFCNHTILSRDLLVVEDLLADSRFDLNPLVVSGPEFRFYAGAPLEMRDGLMAGSLCVLDYVPRRLGERELDQLRTLGTITSALLTQHSDTRRLRELSYEISQAAQVVEQQRQDLQTQKRMLDCASDLAKIGAWEIDCQSGRWTWSEGMFALHEVDRSYTPSQSTPQEFYAPEEYRRLMELVERSRQTNEPYLFEGEMITAKGNKRWVRVAGHVELRRGVPVRRFGMKQDITQEKLAVLEIKRLAERDPLTGLCNRAQFMRRLADIKNHGTSVSLMLLDLDGFKDINDTHGHNAGDECLKEFARRLEGVSGHNWLVARLGGDEFAIIIENPGSHEELEQVARTILRMGVTPLTFEGVSFRCSTSIGIAVSASDAAFSEAELIGQADLALYASKAAGRNRHSFFEPMMKTFADWKVQSIDEVEKALKDGKLCLHYQAKVCLASHEICGYEALLRWNSDDGVRGPRTFSPALEDTRLSLEIGNFVLQSALDQAAEWNDAGLHFGSIAINVGQAQLTDPSFTKKVLDGLSDRGLSPHHLQIEVTEDVFLQRAGEVITLVCNELRQAGVRIALDDFGTGFASLTHLLDFPLSIIKIDRSFIARLSTRAGATGLVKAIVDIGSSLQVEVVAEGVETSEQADFLRSIGCQTAQGYLFHRPGPAEEVSWRAFGHRVSGPVSL